MISTTNLSTSEYETLRFDILLNIEENNNPKFVPYADSAGIATIGIVKKRVKKRGQIYFLAQ